MMIMLDTNICIRIINNRLPLARLRLQSYDAHDVVVCSIVRAELSYGASKSQTPEITRQKQAFFLSPFATLPFDDSVVETYGQVRTHLERAGTPIGPNDLMIASIALTHNLTLVTHNTREFSRVPDLRIEDWED